MKSFDYASAKAAGYTDQEIQDHLNNQQSNDPKAPWLNTVAQMAGGLGGSIIGGIGGAAAGAAVPGLDMTGLPEIAGGYSGGVAGAGVGSGLGNSAADLFRSKVLGDKTINPNKTIPNSIDAAKIGAVGQAIGVPVAKGLGFLAHPIAPFIDMVDKRLASSAKTVNIGDLGGLLTQFEDQIIPKLTKDGYGPEAKDTYNSLTRRITGMAQSRLPHVPADAGVTPDINKLTIPIAEANGIKRDLYQLAKNTYSGIRKATDVMSPLEQSGAADFAKLLKNNIHTQEPGTKIPDAVASQLYKLPDIVSGLTSILPNQGGQAIRTLGNIPKGVIQTLLPKGGGYLNQLLPRIPQLFGGNDQGE